MPGPSQGYDLRVVVVHEGHLGVEADELAELAGGVRALCPEHGADLEGNLKPPHTTICGDCARHAGCSLQ